MLLSEPPSRTRARHRATTEKFHAKEIDAWTKRQGRAHVRVHLHGQLIEVFPEEGYAEYEDDKEKKKRSKIQMFTRASRFRQMATLAKVDRRTAVPTFLTLTYPGEWPDKGEVWKKHLTRFARAAVRHFPKLAAMWKLEPQSRRAPHFHALCWGVARIPWQWIAVRWACIIHGVRGPKKFPMGTGREGAAEFRHWLDNVSGLPEPVKESIRVGTRIEKLRSWNGVAYYVAKYISKPVEGGWESVGRYWGVIGRASMPWSPVEEVVVHYRVAVMIRRTARRYFRSKGYHAPHQRRRVSIITGNILAWIKVCEDACDRATLAPTLALSGTQPLDMRQIYGCHHNRVMREGRPKSRIPF